MPTTQYLWNDISDTVVMEKDGAGNATAVYQSDPVPFGRLRSMRRGGTTYNYHYDGRGNTTYLTDQTGRKTDAYTYDAFGTQRTATGSTENPYRYGGQHGYQYNPATNDYYVRARVYQPKRGRWLSVDPARFLDSANSYQYVLNSGSSGYCVRRFVKVWTSRSPVGLFNDLKREKQACPRAYCTMRSAFGATGISGPTLRKGGW